MKEPHSFNFVRRVDPFPSNILTNKYLRMKITLKHFSFLMLLFLLNNFW